MKKISNVRLFLTVGSVAIVSACSSNTTTTSSPANPGASGSSLTAAQQAFWDAFHASDYASIPEVVSKLQSDYDSNPKDFPTTFLLGHAHFWRLAESGRDPSLGAKAADEAQAASRFFGEALTLNPSESRLLGWLGGIQVIGAAQTNDDAARQKGLAMLDQAVQAYPEFNLFSKALAYAGLPATHPDFATAPRSLFDLIDLCISKPIDREHPDYSTQLADMKAHAALGGHKTPCWNGDKSPHGIEGTFLTFGDLLVKQGKLDAAKAVYASAKAVDSYAAWPKKDALEARLSADLSTWTSTHPSTGNPPFNCTTCHASR